MNTESGDELEEAVSPAEADAPLEFGTRWLFIGVAVVALLIAGTMRWHATQRVESPLIADSVEYLTMARHATDGISLAVKPLRPGLFSLLLAVPLWLKGVLVEDSSMVSGGGGEDPSIALIVLFLFNLLAVFGTYRLGKLLRGPWTGLIGAFIVAILPEFTRWSLDFLTDIPAAALGVWAIVYWIERKPFRVGLMLGLAVAMRYQCFIPLGAFFLVPIVTRRWSDLRMMSLGLLPPVLIIGAVDYYFWGEAFHSLMIFIPGQLTTFFPTGFMSDVLPGGGGAGNPAPVANQAIEAIAASGKLWYIERSGWIFSKPLIYAFLLYPLARRSLRSRPGADLSLWITFVTLLVLSAQRYKEPRYLVAIVPMVAVLGSSSFIWLTSLVTRMLGRTTLVATGVGALALSAFCYSYADACRVLQRKQWFRPFGAFLEAVETIPTAARPSSIGLESRWLLSARYPVQSTGGWAWYSNDFAAFDLYNAVTLFQAKPEEWSGLPLQNLIADLDYILIPSPTVPGEMHRLRWMNHHMTFDGYFFDRRENEIGCLRLLRGSQPPDTRPFWNLNDERARNGAAIAEFATNVQLVGIDVERVPTSHMGAKIDLRWRLPQFDGVRITALVDVFNRSGGQLARFPIWLLPEGDKTYAERNGAALRESHYVTLTQMPVDNELEFRVRVYTFMEPGAGAILEQLKVPGEQLIREGGNAQFRTIIPIRPAAPSMAPGSTSELKSKRSG